MSPVVELEYVEESGPGILELPADVGFGGEEDMTAPAPEVLPGWELKTVQQFLSGIGAGVHLMIGQADHDWEMTQQDLERIGEPLTRILNRWEPGLRLSPYADPLLVAYGFALWGWRSALERARALRDKAALEQTEGPRASYQPTGEAPEQDDVGPQGEPDILAVEPYFQAGVKPRSST